MKKTPKKLGAGFLVLVALSVVLVGSLPRARAQGKSFLWKVSSEQNSIYILGSIHFLRKDNYPLQKVIEDAYEQSRKLVLEIDLASPSAAKVQQLMLAKGVFLDGTTLQQCVSKETYDLVEKRAKELGVDIQAMGSMKPWVVALTMAAMKLRQLGFDQRFGIDHYFAERAKQQGKVVQGLEMPEFQVGLLDQFSRRDQESMLLQTLKEMDLLEDGVGGIINAWKVGDVAAMEKLMLASMRNYPEIQQKLLTDRNRQWLPALEQLLSSSDSVLVIVGAAHLVGTKGVLELLKQRGYRVEQL